MADEIGLIFQCAVCGSYVFRVVEWLSQEEVQVNAGIGNNKQRDLQAAAEQIVEHRVQKRYAGEVGQHFVLRTCPTCIEVVTGIPYETWVDQKTYLPELDSQEVPQSPMLAVIFAEDELPPAYRDKGGTWTLMQGVGPRTLEIKGPNRLQANQFKTLLPPKVELLRPPCWGTPKEGRAPATEAESQEVWDQRSSFIQSVSQVFVSSISSGVNVSERVVELCSAAKASVKDRKRGKAKHIDSDATYIGVPLLNAVDEVNAIVDEWLSEVDSSNFGQRSFRPKPRGLKQTIKQKKQPVQVLERCTVILDKAKIKPNTAVWTYFLKHSGACGKDCISVSWQNHQVTVHKMACTRCLYQAQQAPDNVAKVIQLPNMLAVGLAHSYGQNAFQLHGLPMPRAGEVLGILGCNGIGKSTALNCLAAKILPNLGASEKLPSWNDVIKYYRGSDLQKYFTLLQEDKIKISVKSQIDQYMINMKALKGKKVAQLVAQKDERKVGNQLLEELDMKHLLDRNVKDLSGGELQRLAIALAVMKDVDVYMFDEPTSFLDVKQRLEVTRVIRSLVTSEQVSGERKYVVVVEHDLAILDFMSDYIHCMYGVPGAYGVVAMRASLRSGINNYLGGYLPAENLRFRKEALDFKGTQTEAAEAQLGEYPATTKVLTSEDGTKTFTLHVEAGRFNTNEVIGLLGENGVGKTTLLQMLAGLYDKETSQIGTPEKSFEREPVSLLATGFTVAYKRQDYATHRFRESTESVREYFEGNVHIAFTDHMFKLHVLEPLSIDDNFLELNVASLSGGELQRLAIAECLGTSASVYLLDEPSAGLDCEQRIIVAKVIKRWIRHLRCACFVIEHDFLMMSALADQTILFTGRPGVEAYAQTPASVVDGFNNFLKALNVTFRRDPCNGRPRINKEGSVKDREQKSSGKYYFVDADEADTDDEEQEGGEKKGR